MPLSDLVIWVSNRQISGSLAIDHGTVRKTLTIENGSCVRASSSRKREAVGQHLVNFGLVGEDQLQKAFEVQKETKVLLGRILVMIGALKEEQILSTLQFQIREVVLDAMRWQQGSFRLDVVDPSEERPEIEVSVPLLDLHRENARREPLWESFQAAFPSGDMLLDVHAEKLNEPPNESSMSGRLLLLADAGMSIESIAMELHAPDFQIYAHLFELQERGIIEAKEATGPLPEPIDGLDIVIEEDSNFGRAAREAMDNSDFASAFGHAEAGALSNVSDSDLGALGREAEAKLVEQLESELPEGQSVPRLLRTVEQIEEGRKLSPKERYILTRIDGTRSIRSIMQVSPMRDVDALAVFKSLLKHQDIAV